MARIFETGASRNDDTGKFDFEAFLHPLVVQKFGAYMHRHRKLEDGSVRPGDNWQKGIPKDSAMKSAWRHFHDWWMEHRGYPSREGLDDALCGLLFNVQSYYLSVLQEREKAEWESAFQDVENEPIDAAYVRAAEDFAEEVDKNLDELNAMPDPTPKPKVEMPDWFQKIKVRVLGS